MSTETTAPPHRAGSPQPRSDPRLPIVAFHKGKSPLDVYYSTVDAAQAKINYPRDGFFDMNGAALTLGRASDGSPTMTAGRAGNLVELKQRLLAVLRKSAEAVYAGATIPADIEAILTWFSAAPTLEDVVQGLGLAPTHPNPISEHTLGHKGCKSCTKKQRLAWGVPPCCPG